jgi:hypothetical protein
VDVEGCGAAASGWWSIVKLAVGFWRRARAANSGGGSLPRLPGSCQLGKEGWAGRGLLQKMPGNCERRI